MRRNILLTFLFIIFILSMVTFALSGCAGTTSGEATTETRAMGARSLETAPEGGIIIKDNKFNPIIIAVKVGDTITWINKDPFDHQVKETNGEFDSGTIATEAEFSFTFTKEGTYEYSDPTRPFMTGKINVLK